MASFAKDTQVKLPRPTRVKNKTPAPLQITAEQLLTEARERQESQILPPQQNITDSTELSDYRLRLRKEYEDRIRRPGPSTQVFVNYARWEESQKDYVRARSVWERALARDYKNHALWLKYADFEMKNKFLNSARNVWDRAVTVLPRVDQFWYKYIHMEEMLGNISGARDIFERWMKWSPDQQGWLSFINFELRYQETARARDVYERFVLSHPKPSSYIQYAKFEAKGGEVARARDVYERAVKNLGDDEDLFVAFAEFEERCNEVERARVIYKFGLDRVGRGEELYRKFVAFEKQYGDKEGIDDVIVGRRRVEYEEQVRKSPLNYDAWFDYVRLEEEEASSVGDKERVREVYERAIANVPPANEKRYWRRYIYLWINYALYEEIEAEDVERARQVYRECLKLVPHASFSFAKIWLLAAQFEIRQLNLKGCRKLLGNAIGIAPNKDKIFKKYIEMELQLGEIDRCRRLYERYLVWSPDNCYVWCKFAEFESSLEEIERARGIFELAVSQTTLDLPELVWKGYIDFEMSQGEVERRRALYERLLERTKHYKVWVSFAKYEAGEQDEDEEEDGIERKQECIRRTRAVFDRAYVYYKDVIPEMKEERAKLLEDWFNMEVGFGMLGDVSIVESKLPKKLKKRKAITGEDGSVEYVEYTDYLFPEELQASNLKILEAAYRWKKQKVDAV
ncbi:PREDICTED: crooked neck-like protein 1 [Brassica oleracea var. oleracea]|uniref:Pre-mRNA-splicing factor Syf1/CRNKL1-like C-terminal HAT-repeats domain-containing protein n=1 Tax=Brassica oleracea var. oleracea TaxID=109376 RepID=A0A0D3AYN2_BRAOL|nr:PREDICTED: crooked neck-like protein 1 [Brassica oleracea var. oleracea]